MHNLAEYQHYAYRNDKNMVESKSQIHINVQGGILHFNMQEQDSVFGSVWKVTLEYHRLHIEILA